MDYEKAYKEALRRANAKIETYNQLGNASAVKNIFEIFPELKESEDERIKKALIALLKFGLKDDSAIAPGFNETKEQALAWLEKQGETSYNPYKMTVEAIAEMCVRYSQADSDLKDFFDNVKVKCKDAIEYDKIWLEKLGEQKPQGKQALELWKDMRLEVFLQASGNRHEPNYSDDSTKMFSLTDIDEIFEKIAEKQGEQKTVSKTEPIVEGLTTEFQKQVSHLIASVMDKEYEYTKGYVEWVAQSLLIYAKNEQTSTNNVEPKFKVGDKIKLVKEPKYPAREIIAIKNDAYYFDKLVHLPFSHQDEWELVEQGGKGTVDKIEPKFKVGDFIISKHNSDIVYKITGIGANESHEPEYVCEYVGRQEKYAGRVYNMNQNKVDSNFETWTIQDVKDGDVLVASDGSIFIFKEVVDCGCKHYIALEKDSGIINVNDNLEHFWESIRGVNPSTKGQRNLLFSRMKEAGYEWDVEKKELKKIEQKSTWSEVDENILNDCIKCVIVGSKTSAQEHGIICWLKSLKKRMKGE